MLMPKNRFWLLASILIFSSAAFAGVKVAFFEAKDSSGQLITMEDGGRFYHVAISVDDKWLHTHVYWGVQLIPDLHQLGEPALILENEKSPGLQEADLKQFLNQRYDSTYSWSNPDKTYCSKLVAQILNVAPSPMTFSGTIWRGKTSGYSRELGVSPDDLYRELKKRGFKPAGGLCQQVFKK
ncbi:hypothetical protein ACLVWU_15435 [Bdellovibrio sp. HCB290]|uniref:hypothetical protein n=1 Tax=Bdellovibrio sp. HCB290 TaxID=3394356 RepID=UPI0039B4BB64